MFVKYFNLLLYFVQIFNSLFVNYCKVKLQYVRLSEVLFVEWIETIGDGEAQSSGRQRAGVADWMQSARDFGGNHVNEMRRLTSVTSHLRHSVANIFVRLWQMLPMLVITFALIPGESYEMINTKREMITMSLHATHVLTSSYKNTNTDTAQERETCQDTKYKSCY